MYYSENRVLFRPGLTSFCVGKERVTNDMFVLAFKQRYLELK